MESAGRGSSGCTGSTRNGRARKYRCPRPTFSTKAGPAASSPTTSRARRRGSAHRRASHPDSHTRAITASGATASTRARSARNPLAENQEFNDSVTVRSTTIVRPGPPAADPSYPRHRRTRSSRGQILPGRPASSGRRPLPRSSPVNVDHRLGQHGRQATAVRLDADPPAHPLVPRDAARVQPRWSVLCTSGPPLLLRRVRRPHRPARRADQPGYLNQHWTMEPWTTSACGTRLAHSLAAAGNAAHVGRRRPEPRPVRRGRPTPMGMAIRAPNPE